MPDPDPIQKTESDLREKGSIFGSGSDSTKLLPKDIPYTFILCHEVNINDIITYCINTVLTLWSINTTIVLDRFYMMDFYVQTGSGSDQNTRIWIQPPACL